MTHNLMNLNKIEENCLQSNLELYTISKSLLCFVNLIWCASLLSFWVLFTLTLLFNWKDWSFELCSTLKLSTLSNLVLFLKVKGFWSGIQKWLILFFCASKLVVLWWAKTTFAWGFKSVFKLSLHWLHFASSWLFSLKILKWSSPLSLSLDSSMILSLFTTFYK